MLQRPQNRLSLLYFYSYWGFSKHYRTVAIDESRVVTNHVRAVICGQLVNNFTEELVLSHHSSNVMVTVYTHTHSVASFTRRPIYDSKQNSTVQVMFRAAHPDRQQSTASKQ